MPRFTLIGRFAKQTPGSIYRSGPARSHNKGGKSVVSYVCISIKTTSSSYTHQQRIPSLLKSRFPSAKRCKYPQMRRNHAARRIKRLSSENELAGVKGRHRSKLLGRIYAARGEKLCHLSHSRPTVYVKNIMHTTGRGHAKTRNQLKHRDRGARVRGQVSV